MELACLLFLEKIGLDGVDSLLQVSSPLPPPPTCVVGTSRVPFLLLRVC